MKAIEKFQYVWGTVLPGQRTQTVVLGDKVEPSRTLLSIGRQWPGGDVYAVRLKDGRTLEFIASKVIEQPDLCVSLPVRVVEVTAELMAALPDKIPMETMREFHNAYLYGIYKKFNYDLNQYVQD